MDSSEENGCSEFCRLCLRIIIDAKISFDDTYVLTIVQNFFPGLNLTIFDEPLICKICLEDLISAYKVQKLIANKLASEEKDPLQTQNECFLCLTPQGLKQVGKKNCELRETLDKLFKRLNVKIKATIKKTLSICQTCIDIARGIIESLEHLSGTDSRITEYCQIFELNKIEKTDIHKMHKYVNGLNELNTNNDDSVGIETVLLPGFKLETEAADTEVVATQVVNTEVVNNEVVDAENEVNDENENLQTDDVEDNALHVIVKYQNQEFVIKALKVKNTHYQTCPVCLKTCSRLAGHMKKFHAKHFQGIFFRCTLCPYQTKNKGDLKLGHALTHKSEQEATFFYCDRCPYKAKRKSNMDRHALALHLQNSIKEEFQCSHCPYTTKIPAYLKTHLKCHEMPDSSAIVYRCPHCLYSTIRKKHLTRHVNIHKSRSELTLFKCPECSYETPQKHHLKSHMRCKHTNPDDIVWYNCDFCAYKTKYKTYISKHVTMSHTNQQSLPVFSCLQCSYTTRQKSYLKNHIAYTHSNLEPYKCEKCEFSTKCKSYFNRHVKVVHDKVTLPVYKCNICSYESVIRARLATHMMVHSVGIHPFRCATCGAKYKYKGDYTKHIKEKGHVGATFKTEVDYKKLVKAKGLSKRAKDKGTDGGIKVKGQADGKYKYKVDYKKLISNKTRSSGRKKFK